MEKSAKRIVLKGILVMIVVAVAGFFLFNGFGRHPYTYDELEDAFLAKAAEQNVVGHGEEMLVSDTYGNSVTFVLQTEDGERACGTYGRSMFFDKYKEIAFYAGANGVLALDEMTYKVSDGVIAYEATAQFGDEVGIEFSDEVSPIMYMKFMGICVLAMGVFGIRIFVARKKG